MINETDYDLNFAARPKATLMGSEKEPLIVINEAFLHPERLVQYATTEARFGPGGVAYPGVRAAVPQALNVALFYALQPLAQHVFGVSDDDEMSMTTSFAMVSYPPEKLMLAQALPHYDSTPDKNLAVVVYLCDSSWGGTRFYRHRSTGFERISTDRAESYNRRLADELRMTPAISGYPDAAHPLFDVVQEVEARFNRLVLYRSRALHSGIIVPTKIHSEDPAAGRLTLTAFMEAATPAHPPGDHVKDLPK